jgi:hypothetical protein
MMYYYKTLFLSLYDVFVRIIDDEINICICISAIHKYVQLISKLCFHNVLLKPAK